MTFGDTLSTEHDLVDLSVDQPTFGGWLQTNQPTLNWLVATNDASASSLLISFRGGAACCEAVLLLQLWRLLQRVLAVAVCSPLCRLLTAHAVAESLPQGFHNVRRS